MNLRLVALSLVAGALLTTTAARADVTKVDNRPHVPDQVSDDDDDDDECKKIKDSDDRAKCEAIRRAKDKNKDRKEGVGHGPIKDPDAPVVKKPTRPGDRTPDKITPPKRLPDVKNPGNDDDDKPKPKPPRRTPPPDKRQPGSGGGGGGGGGSRNNRADCCAMAGLGTGGMIIGGLTGLLGGAAIGGAIGFAIPPDPKTESQRAIDAGVGAVIGGGAGMFLGGAIGLGLGLSAAGMLSGEE